MLTGGNYPLLWKVLRWALIRSRRLDGCEEVPHVERKVVDAVIFCDRSNRAKVNAFLAGVRRDVRPDLLQKVEDVPAT